MQLPAFLNDFQPELERYKLDTVRIDAAPLDPDFTLPLDRSKLLGLPFLPPGIAYPHSKNGQPMILWAQINFSEVPRLEHFPDKGLLQFFVAAADWYDMDDFAICYHPELTDAYQADFSFLTQDLYDECPIDVEHELSFEKTTEYGGSEDFRFDMLFNGRPYADFVASLPEAQQEAMQELFSADRHKIGGYAYFTQHDPRAEADARKDDVLLLQIDTDERIMFGDSGIAHLFIHKDDLINRCFDKAWFQWDCC